LIGEVAYMDASSSGSFYIESDDMGQIYWIDPPSFEEAGCIVRRVQVGDKRPRRKLYIPKEKKKK